MFGMREDFRQSSEYSNFMFLSGWHIKKFFLNKKSFCLGYIWRIPILKIGYLSLQRVPINLDIKKIIKFALKNKIVLIKVDFDSNKKINKFNLEKYGFTTTVWCNAPTKTRIIYLKKYTESEIFNQMKPKTRYNIRLALKKNYKIRFLGLNEFKSMGKINFENLIKNQEHNKKIKLINYEQMEKILTSYGDNGWFIVAEKENKIMATALFLCSKTTVFYTQNFSTKLGKVNFAPTLIIWEAIKYARNKNLLYFDFEGIYDSRNISLTESWKGFTKFKNSFGGSEVKYVLPFEWRKKPSTKLDKIILKLSEEYFKHKRLPSIYPSLN